MISYCALTFAAWYFFGLVALSFIQRFYIYLPLVLSGIVFLSVAAAAAAAALSHLTAKAADIKSENDMTI